MPSRVIRGFRYLSSEGQLEIIFVSGRRYRYRNVPESVYRQMRASFSKGEFFNRHIRDQFEFVPVERAKDAHNT
jgi:hypothetical protein